MPRQITLGLAFTDEELCRAIELRESDPEHFHARCRDEIVRPAIERINLALEQPNDPDFLAYWLEYALVKTHMQVLKQTTEKHDDRTQ